MRVLVGTYRKLLHVHDALQLLEKFVTGITDIVFIDDSGDDATATHLADYGKVVEVGARGYGTAMKAACHAAEGTEAFWIEEDFQITAPTNLLELAEILYHRPYLAQIVLLRGPHFPVEHEHGGLIEALRFKGHKFSEVNGVIEHTACFSGNPSVWRGEVFAAGWPTGRLSEEIKGSLLLRQGFRFGYLPGIRCTHTGERSGHDY